MKLAVAGCGAMGSIRNHAAVDASGEPFDLVIAAGARVRAAVEQARCVPEDETVAPTIQDGLGSSELVAEVVGEVRLAAGIAGGFGAAPTALAKQGEAVLPIAA